MLDEQQMNQEETGTDSNASSSWLDSLPKEIKAAESLTKFKDVTALAQSYLEAEKAFSSRVAVPKADSSEEEWHKFYQKLGLPEDKKYTDQRTKENEESLQACEKMFYQSGLSKKQGERLLQNMAEYSNNLQQQQLAESEQVKNSNINWLKERYANSFDSNIALMQAALQQFGSKELASLIEESGYSPALVELLVKVGSILQSDSLVLGAEKPPITNADSALQEIKRLESDPDFMVKLKDKSHTSHDEVVRQLEQLYQLAYNNK